MSEPDWLKVARERGLLGKETAVRALAPVEAASTRPDMSEADWQELVVGVARANGWLVAHFRKVRIQRKGGATYWATPVAADGAGYPDLHLVRGGRSVFAELKTDAGRLSPAQDGWAAALRGAGVGYFVWRPADWVAVRGFLEGEV